MNYHVVLDLTPQQVRKLRQKALDEDTTIKKLVTMAVEENLKIFKED